MLNNEDKDFVRMLYRQAKKKKKQIGVLAELYACNKEQIEEVLGLSAEDVAPPVAKVTVNRRRYSSETRAALVKAVLVDGEQIITAASRYSVRKQTAYNWVNAAKQTCAKLTNGA